jgi:fructose-1,6-bisphosphatase
MTMSSQQEADCALAIWLSHRGDDQQRMDSILKEFFAQVRADEYEHQLRLVSEEMSCPITTKQLSSSSAPSQSA